MSLLSHVTSQSFQNEVVNSDVPVLIDFYADWCGPCRQLAPTLDRLSVEFAGRARIVKVDVDAEPALAQQFRVEAIPTLAFVSEGRVVHQAAGLLSESQLRQALTKLVA